MRRFIVGVSWILVVGYPFIVFLGLRSFTAKSVVIALIVLALARIVIVRRQIKDSFLPTLLSIVMLLLAVYALMANNPDSLLYYPVAVNAVLLGLFSYSLLNGPSFVERLARITEPQLSARAVIYTRKVTFVWCVFFLCNGSIALYTATFSSHEAWTVYNGLVAYLLIGLVMSVEYVIRRRVKRADYVGTV